MFIQAQLYTTLKRYKGDIYAMLVEKGKIIKISEEEIAGKCEATAAESFLKDI